MRFISSNNQVLTTSGASSSFHSTISVDVKHRVYLLTYTRRSGITGLCVSESAPIVSLHQRAITRVNWVDVCRRGWTGTASLWWWGYTYEDNGRRGVAMNNYTKRKAAFTPH